MIQEAWGKDFFEIDRSSLGFKLVLNSVSVTCSRKIPDKFTLFGYNRFSNVSSLKICVYL